MALFIAISSLLLAVGRKLPTPWVTLDSGLSFQVGRVIQGFDVMERRLAGDGMQI